ncbi:hypothetical protein [Thermoflexus sp.]|uniref:hypothetical protein n=1 Tax=Thermoflexus sp. TaxID=1969742 RepID=UPI002ADDBE45|nr:hypothetical protein [Thermoflexus sp.]
MTRRNHALLALSAIALGWALMIFTIWRLYPEQSPARLLVTLGIGLTVWGFLWFPMEFLHRRFSAQEEEESHKRMMEQVWRRSGWGALWVSVLAMLFLQRALRWEWSLLFGTLLLGAELLWMATESSQKPGSLLTGRRRVGRR